MLNSNLTRPQPYPLPAPRAAPLEFSQFSALKFSQMESCIPPIRGHDLLSSRDATGVCPMLRGHPRHDLQKRGLSSVCAFSVAIPRQMHTLTKDRAAFTDKETRFLLAFNALQTPGWDGNLSSVRALLHPPSVASGP